MDLVQRHFDSKREACEKLSKTGRNAPQQRELEQRLTMEHLSSHYGYNLRWTGNLAEHLQIDLKSREIAVFEHKICLRNFQRFGGLNVPLPADVVGEALNTLNLLFPLSDKSTKSFLRNKRSFYGLGHCGRDRQLVSSAYRYWRTEIDSLANIVLETPRG